MELKQPLGQGRLAVVYELSDTKVVKLFYDHIKQSSVKYEYDILTKVGELINNTAHCYEIIEYEDRKGIVMDRINGITMMEMLKSKIWKIPTFGMQLAELQFQYHQATTTDLPDYRDELRQEIDRVQYVDQDIKDLACQVLDNLPAENKLCHGDFHPDNIIIADQPYIIDWITGKSGHPLFDVSRTMLMLQYSSPPKGFTDKLIAKLFRKPLYKAYINRYFELSGTTRTELDRFELPVLVARLLDNIEDERQVLLDRIAVLVRQIKQTPD